MGLKIGNKEMSGKFVLPAFLFLLSSAIIYFSFSQYKKIKVQTDNPIISAGVVPHHLLAKQIIRDFFIYISRNSEPETIIILSPDHFNSSDRFDCHFVGLKTKALSKEDENRETDFLDVKTDDVLIEKLSLENKICFSRCAVISDHGVTNLMPFIAEYFPNAKVVPLLISRRASMQETQQLANSINRFFSPKVIVIASVDFSHYLPSDVANFHDVKSIRTLLNFEKQSFKKLEVDSWQALYIARAFARFNNSESYKIIDHKNSADFFKNEYLEETTSYFSVVFENTKGEELSSDYYNADIGLSKTVLFVGDIMLDRGVEWLMQKNSIFYPYERIRQFLIGNDIVFGNLEGPIVYKPKYFPDSSLQFAFSSDVLEGLSFANFSLLSLANNHTLNMEKKGLAETKEILTNGGIDFVGDPILCDLDFSFEKQGIRFLSINKTFPFNCSEDEIQENIRIAKTRNPDDFLVVVFHWGQEYQLKHSSTQQNIAYKAINAGADVVIGSHPHVVQDIEMYKGKLIFYSLGNFIFDQYFSDETQEGLAVGLEISPNKLTYRLFPIDGSLSQPSLMKIEESKKFLNDLAKISDKRLLDSIKNGMIKIKK